jgi:N-acetyl sugar amidotransferase
MHYQICSRCVTDSTDPTITFNIEGVCNHCVEAEQKLPNYRFTPAQEAENLTRLAKKVRSKNSGKYDAIIGLSGGVDSSYVTHLAKKLNLNPLIVHFDNGWNSEKSVSNIKKIIDACGFDLQTYVINWPEFRDLQRSFFKAGVVDIEILSDHAILATLFKLRRQYGVKYVLSGANYTTEHGMPLGWLWRKQDFTNIKSIHAKYGTVKIKEFPRLGSFQFQIIQAFGLGGTYLEPLNMINYSKAKAIRELEETYGWEYYGGKHYESVFTKFYQGYVLPVKFGFDKRRPHLSALIRNGEITRDQAIVELDKPIYSALEMQQDKEYVLKKLGFMETEFDDMMREAPKSHLAYASDEWMFTLWNKYKPVFLQKILRAIKTKQ